MSTATLRFVYTSTFARAFIVIFLLAALLFVPSLPVGAQTAAFPVCGGPAADSPVCVQATRGDNTQGQGIFGPGSVVTRVTETIIFVSAAVAVLMIVVGGFRYVLSQGDPQATQNAKNTIIYAIVGVVIAISAQVILSLVLSRI